jgi:uncharacterized membrane protein
MSLKIFHVVFVSCSSLLAFLVGGWAFAQGGVGAMVGGVASILAGLGLIVYGVYFWRKITTPEEERRRRRRLLRAVTLVATTLVVLSLPNTAHACSVCYGEAAGPMLDGARWGVYFLLGVLVAVQIGFASFFLYLRRRSRRINGPITPWWNDLTEAHEP